jgi:hypothetical protein
MYCTKCGKQIDYDSPICKECVDAMATSAESQQPAPVEDEWEQPVVEQTEEKTLQPGESVEVVAPVTTYAAPSVAQPAENGSNPRMRGFGKALTSTILGFIGYFFAVFTMAMISSGEGDVEIAGMIFFMMSCPLAIIPFIFGLKSIGTFKSTPAGTPKPIATLIMGIVGLSFAALSLLFLFFAMIVLLGVMVGV